MSREPSRERPILFSSPMVRALLAGTKMQTRRVAKIDDVAYGKPVQWVSVASCTTGIMEVRCPYGEPGDRLWVRETWSPDPPIDSSWASTEWNGCGRRIDGVPERFQHPRFCNYSADWLHGPIVWRPSIHMPRWASRLTLEITGVRVERLQEISEADAVAEGCKADPFPGPWWQGYRDKGETPPSWMIEPKRIPHKPHLDRSAVDAYRALWMQINGRGSWDANPWVWVLEFRTLERQ